MAVAAGTGDYGWLLVAASSCACCLGASVVFIDRFASRLSSAAQLNLEGSPRFLAASLSLASGVMLFSALFSLLPEAVEDLTKATPPVRKRAPQIAVALYFAGVAFTLFVNKVVRLLTPGSACPCDGQSVERYGSDRAPRPAGENVPRAVAAEEEANGAAPRSPPSAGRPRSAVPPARSGETGFVPSWSTSPPKSDNVYHCKGLYQDHAFLHQHQHTPRLAVTEFETLDGRDSRAPPPGGPTRYGTLGRRNSCPVNPNLGSAPPGEHGQESRHYHHQHHYPHPYQNIWYNCSSNLTLSKPLRRGCSTSNSSSLRPLLQPPVAVSLSPHLTVEGEDTAEESAQTKVLVASDGQDVLPNYADPNSDIEGGNQSMQTARDVDECSINSSARPCLEAEKKDREELLRIGVQTAVAISLHKFPEGLITFVGSKASSAMGLSVFLAIFIHNIPEGLMIAVPLLVATSSRTKAFTLASILGGLSQPLGAAVGYLILPSDAHLPGGHAPGVNSVYGCLFAFVSGLMTCVVIQGMLPAAVRFDPSGHIVTTGFFSGVALVAVTWAFLGGEI